MMTHMPTTHVSQAEALEAASTIEGVISANIGDRKLGKSMAPLVTLINYVRGLVEDELTRPVLPGGLVLVPREPTESMVDAPSTIVTPYAARLIYERMVDAAPHPVEEAPVEPSPEARDAAAMSSNHRRSCDSILNLVFDMRCAIRNDSCGSASQESYEAAVLAEGDLIAAIEQAFEPAEAEPMTPERIDHIADLVVKGMPDGLRGFCKTWGWQQFARALFGIVLQNTTIEASKASEGTQP